MSQYFLAQCTFGSVAQRAGELTCLCICIFASVYLSYVYFCICVFVQVAFVHVEL